MTKTRKTTEEKLAEAHAASNALIQTAIDSGAFDEDTTDPTLPMGKNGNSCVDDEDDEYAGRGNSVVAATFKARYRERAVNMARKPKGVAVKALKRSCSDWLAIELAKRTLDEKQKLNVAAFESILSANGVKHDHWNRTSAGWQGRLRMTGRLALQRIVAENDGELVIPGEGTIKAPRVWVERTLR